MSSHKSTVSEPILAPKCNREGQHCSISVMGKCRVGYSRRAHTTTKVTIAMVKSMQDLGMSNCCHIKHNICRPCVTCMLLLSTLFAMSRQLGGNFSTTNCFDNFE